MDYVNLGKTGLKVSRICLGCMTYGAPATGALRPGSHAWALNEEESQPFFRQALDLGINFFDTANVGMLWLSPPRYTASCVMNPMAGPLPEIHFLRAGPEPPPARNRLR